MNRPAGASLFGTPSPAGPSAWHVWIERLVPLFFYGLFVTPFLFVAPWIAIKYAGKSLLISWHITCVAGLVALGGVRTPGSSLLKSVRRPVALVFLLFCIFIWLSIFQANNRTACLYLATLWTQVWVLFVIFPCVVDSAKKREALFDVLIAVGAVVALHGLLCLLPPAVWGREKEFPNLLGNRNFTAQFLVLPLFLVLHRFLSARLTRWKISYLVLGMVMSSYIVASRCRAVWLGLAVALLWVLVRKGSRMAERARRWTRFRMHVLLLAAALLAMAVFLLIFDAIGAAYRYPTLAQTLSTFLYPLEGSAGGRLKVWLNTLVLIKDHFWWGVGIGNWREVYYLYRDRLVPTPGHPEIGPFNVYIQIFSETGIFGLLSLGALVYLLFTGRYKPEPVVPFLRLALVTMLVDYFFHVHFNISFLMLMFVTEAGILAHFLETPDAPPPRAAGLPWLLAALCLACSLIQGQFFKARTYRYIIDRYLLYDKSADGKLDEAAEPKFHLSRGLQLVQSVVPAFFDGMNYRKHRDELVKLGPYGCGFLDSMNLLLTISLKELGARRYQEALFWLEKAQDLSPYDPRVNWRKCYLYFVLGHLEDAHRLCTDALAFEDDALALKTLAAIELRRSSKEAALAYYVKARDFLDGQINRHANETSFVPGINNWYKDYTACEANIRQLRREVGLPTPPEELLRYIARAPLFNKAVAVTEEGVYFSGTLTGQHELWRYDPKTEKLSLLSNDTLDYFRLRAFSHPFRCYFVSDRFGDYNYDLFVRTDKPSILNLTKRRRGVSQAEFEVAPDRKQLAFKSETGGSDDLWVMDLESGRKMRLTRDGGAKNGIAWRRRLGQLASVRNRHELTLYNLTGGERTILFQKPGHEIKWPVFSDDGGRLIFVDEEPSGLSVICQLNVATRALKTLTLRKGYYLTPRWLDDQRVLFREQANDQYLLRLLDLDTLETRPLGPAGGVVYPFELAPDRRRVYFFYGHEKQPISLAGLDLETGRWKTFFRNDWIREEEVVVHEKIRIQAEGAEIPLYLYKPSSFEPGGKYPCLIWLHGGSDNFSPRWNPYAQYFAHAGFVFAAMNYRGGPGPYQNLGLPKPFKAFNTVEQDKIMARDVLALYGQLASLDYIDRRKIFVLGVSTGSQVAGYLLRNHGALFAGGVEYSGLAAPYFQHPPAGLPPILFVQGEYDAHVSLKAARRQIQQMRRAGNDVRQIVYPREGHDFRRRKTMEDHLEATVSFLREVLSRLPEH